jgi:UDP:flavonoid glycosyltransferase YjiC (YdhE family)
MARILCAWELGSELGHLSKLRQPIAIALSLGHQVFLAARELRRVKLIMGDLPITYLQTPMKHRELAPEPLFMSFAQMLASQCFSSVDEVEMLLRAWDSLFDLVQPELVMFEHAPTALAAAHQRRFRKLLVGSGFMVPPLPLQARDPFAPFITTQRTPQVLDELRAGDARLLALINQALARLDAAPLASVADLYAQADHYFLMTVPHLDHFGQREGMHYIGVEAPRPQPAPQWPPGSGPKVFGYLQPMPALEQLLRDLRDAKVCALLCVRDLPARLRETYSSDQIRFIDHLVDLAQVAREASWVINHANHNSAAVFLLAGVPQLVIPLHQEQLMAVMRLANYGGAVLAFQDQQGFVNEITVLNTNSRIRQQAARVAAECASIGIPDAGAYIRGALQALLA